MPEPRPDPSTVSDSTARVLVDAVNAAHARGLHVLASADHGVTCISMHARERWIPDHRSRGVSPLGAAILYVQPEPPEVEVAACVALGASAPFLMGFVAGVAGEPPHASWQSHVARLLIGEGYALGREFRVLLLTDVCELHHRRHRRWEPCPECSDLMPTPIDPRAGLR